MIPSLSEIGIDCQLKLLVLSSKFDKHEIESNRKRRQKVRSPKNCCQGKIGKVSVALEAELANLESCIRETAEVAFLSICPKIKQLVLFTENFQNILRVKQQLGWKRTRMSRI